jgi:uncharacterized iron-regulated membrane protein
MSIRRIIFWSHLVVGLSVGTIVAFLAATGCILALQPQIVRWAERGTVISTPAPMASCVTPSVLLEDASRVASANPTTVTFFSDPHVPAQIAFGPDRLLLADACRGTVLAPGAERLRVFFANVRDLHRWVALNGVRHERLRAIKDAGSLGFGLLIVSGLFMWLPRQISWKHLRPVTLLRFKLRGRARDWNWHNVFGFWMAVPLLIIVATGAVMAYPWANAVLYKFSGSPLPTRVERPDMTGKTLPKERWPKLNAAIQEAEGKDPRWHSLQLRMPMEKDTNLSFMIDEGEGGKPMERSQLILALKDGHVVRWETYYSVPRGRRWRLINRYLHTGEIFGLTGQIVALLAALSALLLVYTGFALALRRWRSWRKRLYVREHSSESSEKVMADV